MAIVEVILVVVVLFGIAAVACGRGGSMADAPADGWVPELPHPLHATDVERVRFALAFRGYRMSDVDTVLDRLAAEIERRDVELDELRERTTQLTREPPEQPARHRAPALEPGPGTERTHLPLDRVSRGQPDDAGVADEAHRA